MTSGFRVQTCGLPRNDKALLLSVFRHDLVAGPADPGAVLLQAGQHDRIAVVHASSAKPRDVARAGVMALLRPRLCGHQNKRKNQENSEHLITPCFTCDGIKIRRAVDVNARQASPDRRVVDAYACLNRAARTVISVTLSPNCDIRHSTQPVLERGPQGTHWARGTGPALMRR
jgi:hypothetical protein